MQIVCTFTNVFLLGNPSRNFWKVQNCRISSNTCAKLSSMQVPCSNMYQFTPTEKGEVWKFGQSLHIYWQIESYCCYEMGCSIVCNIWICSNFSNKKLFSECMFSLKMVAGQCPVVHVLLTECKHSYNEN